MSTTRVLLRSSAAGQVPHKRYGKWDAVILQGDVWALGTFAFE